MSLADKKIVGGGFSNEAQLVRVVYDFAVDGGAVGDYDVLEAAGNCVVQMLYADVKTAVTATGSLVMDLGKGDGGTEFWSDIAKATLALDAIVPHENNAFVELSNGEKIVLGIEVDAALTGKVEFVFKVYSR